MTSDDIAEASRSASLELRDWNMEDPCENCGEEKNAALMSEGVDQDWEEGTSNCEKKDEEKAARSRPVPPPLQLPPCGLPPSFAPPFFNPLQGFPHLMQQQCDFMNQVYIHNLSSNGGGVLAHQPLPHPHFFPHPGLLPEAFFPPSKRARTRRDPPPSSLPPFVPWPMPKPHMLHMSMAPMPFGFSHNVNLHRPNPLPTINKVMEEPREPRHSSSTASSPRSGPPTGQSKLDSPDLDTSLSCDELPLDLSCKTSSNSTSIDGGETAAEKLRTPRKPSKPKKLQAPLQDEKCTSQTGECSCKTCEETATKGAPFANFKRNYSQTDLNQAVNDIRNGRLGTRRASVVYGIPRSTLRNKIYKLEAAEEQQGIVTNYKRRKPGGQSNAEKRLAEESERARLSSPLDDGDESSESTDEIKDDEVKSENNELLDSPSSVTTKTPTWSETPTPDWHRLFQTVFNPLVPEELVRSELLGGVALLPALNGLKASAPGFLPPPPPLTTNLRLPSQVVVSPSNQEDADWKRSRPKRGQYRKYDKLALDEAVKSVRRGEMSVHRAGSYFGVPHSTLEYKVKERNLMRVKRKKTDTTSSNEGSAPPEGVEKPETPVTSAPPALVV